MKKAKRNYILSQIVVWTVLVLLVVSLVVCIVGVVLAESKAGTGEEHGAWVMAIVAVSVDLLAIACAVPAFRRMERALLALFDAAERADSEDSFLFGDDVLGTFGENGITMHTSHAAMDEMRPRNRRRGAEEEGARDYEDTMDEVNVQIPYHDMTFSLFSMRRFPADKGERSLLVKIPDRYLTRKGGEGTSSVVTLTWKKRLQESMERYRVRYESYSEGRKKGKVLFSSVKRTNSPKRKSGFLFLAIGIALVVAGIALAFTSESSIGLPVALAAFGVILGGKGAYSLVKSGKSGLQILESGVYWKEEEKKDGVFFCWEDIESVRLTRRGKETFLLFRMPFGEYFFPDRDGLSAFLKENFAIKWSAGK